MKAVLWGRICAGWSDGMHGGGAAVHKAERSEEGSNQQQIGWLENGAQPAAGAVVGGKLSTLAACKFGG